MSFVHNTAKNLHRYFNGRQYTGSHELNVMMAVITAGLAGGHWYTWDRYVGVFGKNPEFIMAGLVLTWIFGLFFMWLNNREFLAQALDRVSDLVRGWHVDGKATGEVLEYGAYTLVYGVIAYGMDGRMNSFATGGEIWQRVFGFALSVGLWFPPVTTAFIAVTAFKVRSFPKPGWYGTRNS